MSCVTAKFFRKFHQLLIVSLLDTSSFDIVVLSPKFEEPAVLNSLVKFSPAPKQISHTQSLSVWPALKNLLSHGNIRSRPTKGQREGTPKKIITLINQNRSNRCQTRANVCNNNNRSSFLGFYFLIVA